jgi:hypothetical protein
MIRNFNQNNLFDNEMAYRSYLMSLNFIPPEGESACLFGCCGHNHAKAETASTIELSLASRPHRWKEMRKLQKEFFLALLDKVLEYQDDILSLFNLPSIEIIRNSFKEDVEIPGIFELKTGQVKGYERILNEWQNDIIGQDFTVKEITPDQVPIYDFYELGAYGIGIEKTMQAIIDNLPEGVNPTIITNTQIVPDVENFYYKEMKKNGLRRVKKKFKNKYYKFALKQLKKMAKEGASLIDVGRFIYKNVGEGEAWYWNRIARSESALAANASFNAQSQASDIRYEQWSAAANACPICSAFDGNVWRVGEGPEPVSDTHPHCGCIRGGYYQPPRAVQSPWERQSPYDNPYSREEILGLPAQLTRRRAA